MKRGKSTNQAVIRTMANKNAQNFATKRLLQDLEEFQKNDIPTVGVTAQPLDNNLFIWHANIRGPEKTLYEGGIFHLIIEIPESYPHSPPTITIPSTIPHPNVFGNSVCLDMLTPEGWSSAYTILSVLIQLQSFLFEKNYDEKITESTIRKAVEQSNQYKCEGKSCKHGGKLACHPLFNVEETNPDAFKILSSEKQLFRKEILCYHTKLDLKKTSIGIGISISRVPRTGAISQASPCLDFLSLKAFLKEGVRNGIDKERKFMNWLPLYFGEDREKILHLGKRAISMIFTNNTKRFSPKMVVELFPKILLTLNFLMMDEKMHCSIRYIRLWTHIHALFLLFLEEFKECYDIMEKSLDDFLNNEAQRNKENTPNLGILLFYLLVSRKHKCQQILQTYFDEQLDRQVFWLLQAVPELGDESFDKDFGEQRAQHTFKVQSTSYQIFALSLNMIKIIRGEKPASELLKNYEENLCKLSNAAEENIQKVCFDILKLKNYEEFFKIVGLPVLSAEQVICKLRQAVINSKNKKYHGTIDEVFSLPSTDEQIKLMMENIPKLEDFIDPKTKALKSEISENQWKEACCSRYYEIKEILNVNPLIEPVEVRNIMQNKFLQRSEKPDDMLTDMKKFYLKHSTEEEFNPKQIPINLQTCTWKHIFIQLDLQDHLKYMDLNPDFHVFYEKLDAAKDFVEILVFPVIVLKNLKSGSHYLTASLEKLTSLKILILAGLNQETKSFLSMKILKCLSKGFNNFVKNGGKLERFEIQNVNLDASRINEALEKLWKPIFELTEVNSLHLKMTELFRFDGSGKYLSNFITVQKNLFYLDLSSSNMHSTQAKLLADGLMRAKQLETIILKQNNNIGYQAMSSIIYNLAFSPRLKYIDISSNSYEGGHVSVVESLYKLLRITGSLETLIINNSKDLNKNLIKEFFISLGEIKSLKHLDLSFSGEFTNAVITILGKAIAFNSKKKGSLKIVKIEGCIPTFNELNTLHNSMNISLADNEEWYGDAGKVSKMTGTDFQKVFFNSLEVLKFSKSPNLKSNFNLASFKKGYNLEDPELVKLISRSSNLQIASFEECGLGKNGAALLSLAFDPTNREILSNIKILNLSKNFLGHEGCKTISEIFKINKTIEVFDISNNKIGVPGAQSLAIALESNTSLKVLNLFSNNIDVDGARSFQKMLSKNSTLQWIDFGHNRIRDEGLTALAKGISQNENSNIHTLGLRFNFISGDAMNEFLTTVYGNGEKRNLKNMFIKNNDISEYELNILHNKYVEMKLRVEIDAFDKFQYLVAEKLERTIWVHPCLCSTEKLKDFLENEQKCGIVVDIRKRMGPKWLNRTQKENVFFFVEFANKLSVTRALQIASKKKAIINGVTFRIFKGGSGTYLFSKNLTKNKSKSQTNYIQNTRGIRGGRGGRGLREARGGFTGGVPSEGREGRGESEGGRGGRGKRGGRGGRF